MVCRSGIVFIKQLLYSEEKNKWRNRIMRSLLKIVSLIGLLATIVPSLLVFWGVITLDSNKVLMIIGTLLWFSTAPFWMNKKA